MNRPRSFFVLLLVLISTLLLAACGGKSKKNLPPSVIVTVQAEPVSTLLPGCKTDEMVSWYEVASTLIVTFKDESVKAMDLAPADLPVVINTRLIPLRDKIGEQPAPECASMAQNDIMLYMRQVLQALQGYANGDLSKEDMHSQVQAAVNQIDNTVMPLLSGTQASLEQRLREEHATQAAGGSGQ